MATSRKILVVSALALACHFAALAVHSALASSILEFCTDCFDGGCMLPGVRPRFRFCAPLLAINGHCVCAVLRRPSARNLLRQRAARIAERLVAKRRSFSVSRCADGHGALPE